MTWLGLTGDQWYEYAAFLLIAGGSLVTALGVLFSPRILHAAVWLLMCLLCIGGFYALLGAHVLFGVQVLVYAGAIAVMIIFAVVLLERGRGMGILSGTQHMFAGFVGAAAIGVSLLAVVGVACWMGHFPSTPATNPPVTNVAAIGQLFLTRDLLAFELISVVLLVAMVGALVLARPDKIEVEPLPEDTEGHEGFEPPLSAGKEVWPPR
jgi:NADH-quinone oxidoreductase subunit J